MTIFVRPDGTVAHRLIGIAPSAECPALARRLRRSGRRIRLLSARDELSRQLPDQVRRPRGVVRRQVREHRRVGHAQTLDTVHAQLRVQHRHRVRRLAHLGCARAVVTERGVLLRVGRVHLSCIATLTSSYMLRGRFDEAAAALNEGLDLAREAGEGFWEAELHRLRGEVFHAQGAKDEAEKQFERAIVVARERREKSLELRALMSLFRVVRLRARADRADQVRLQLAETYDWFTENFETADLREAKLLLADELGT
jgi:tetratricopeptide (TPR) repeat protein